MAKLQHGIPVRQHLESVERQTKQRIDILHPDPPHFAIAHIWGWFQELNASRPMGFDVGGISYAEIEAWARLSRIPITPHEVKVIKVIDSIFLNEREKEGEDGRNRSESRV